MVMGAAIDAKEKTEMMRDALRHLTLPMQGGNNLWEHRLVVWPAAFESIGIGAITTF